MTTGQGDRLDGFDVEPLRPSDAAEAGELLSASHHDYPAFRHLFPDPAMRRRVLQPFMAGAAGDAARFRRCLAARDAECMLGVALWMPPGTYPPSALRKARMAPDLFRAAVAARGSFLAFARVGAALERAHPGEPSWYLQALGVHPRGQRRGVGRRLLTPTLALADETGETCLLHTSDPANVEYYRRFGFEITQPMIRVFPNGPDYIGMSRAPRAPQ